MFINKFQNEAIEGGGMEINQREEVGGVRRTREEIPDQRPLWGSAVEVVLRRRKDININYWRAVFILIIFISQSRV